MDALPVFRRPLRTVFALLLALLGGGNLLAQSGFEAWFDSAFVRNARHAGGRNAEKNSSARMYPTHVAAPQRHGCSR